MSPDTEKTPAPTPSADPATTAPSPSAEPQTTADPKVAPAAEPQDAPAAADSPQAPKARSVSTGSVILDTALVLVLVAALGYGGYFLSQELPKYRVPSPMELELQKNQQLRTQYDALLDKSYHADEQLAMRHKLAELDKKLATMKEELAQGDTELQSLKTQILGVQHEIRQADKEARSVARGLLSGLPMGSVTTLSGKRFDNATLHKVIDTPQGRKVVLRSAMGQVSFLLNDLVQDNLPEIFLYAYGFKDLVDMSDFTAADGSSAAPAGKKPAKKTTAKKPTTPRRGVIIINGEKYEPTSGSPVVDTEANRNTTVVPTEEMPIPDDIWQAPEGELPIQ